MTFFSNYYYYVFSFSPNAIMILSAAGGVRLWVTPHNGTQFPQTPHLGFLLSFFKVHCTTTSSSHVYYLYAIVILFAAGGVRLWVSLYTHSQFSHRLFGFNPVSSLSFSLSQFKLLVCCPKFLRTYLNRGDKGPTIPCTLIA